MEDFFDQMSKMDPKELFPEGTKIEKIIPEPDQPPADQPPADQPPLDKPPAEVDEHLKFLNEKTGLQFKDYEEIKGHVNKSAKTDELTKKMTDFEQKMTLLKEYEDTISNFNDPSKYFADESEMKRQQLLIKYGKEMNRDVLGQITSDLSGVDELTKAIMAKRLEYPKLTESQAKQIVCDETGGDPDEKFEDWSDISKAKLYVKASDADKKFKEINESVKLPDKFDPIAFKTQREAEKTKRNELLTSDWTPIVNKGAELSKGVRIPGKDEKGEDITLFEFAYSDEFKKTIPEQAMALIKEYNLDKTKENYESVMATIENRFALNNLPKMFDAFEKNIVAREAKKVYDKKTHPSDDHEKGKTGEDHDSDTDQSEQAAKWLADGRIK
jgi:hypothetical protein